ncbi:hypothetical protein [Algisphaera agarilytica]|uniref:HNH endonuclease n=1 Tax=Algisphaera agarilytica TaxID=1385975 RepID=A0A7X0LJH8_9BACT|nr:hypothetical protein [Algisphaera agarilytica]MBB6428852.1 hypothetical protein [Algisphaera agarilytica]
MKTPTKTIVRREPYRETDKNGREVVRVPLAGGLHTATLYAEDFDRIIADGWSDQWQHVSNYRGRRYVRVCHRDGGNRRESIHRLVVDAGPGQAVMFKTDNTLDLRPSNLIVCRKKDQQRPYVTHLLYD